MTLKKEIKIGSSRPGVERTKKYKLSRTSSFFELSHNNSSCTNNSLVPSGGGAGSVGDVYEGEIVMREQCGVGIKEFLKTRIFDSFSNTHIVRYIPSSAVEPYSTGKYAADGSEIQLTPEQKSKILNLTYIQSGSSLAGLVAGLIFAYKKKKGFWGYVGFGILGSMIFGGVAWIVTIPMKKKIVMSIDTNGSSNKSEQPVSANDSASSPNMSVDDAKAIAKAISDKVRSAKSSRLSAEARAELQKEINSMTDSLKQAGFSLVRTKDGKDVETLSVKRRGA